MRTLVATLGIFSIFLTQNTFAAEVHPAVQFIEQMGVTAVEYGEIRSVSEKRAKFCELVKRNTTADLIIRPVLGRYYDQATDRQLKDIKNYIYDLLAKHLIEAFEQANGGRLKVSPRVINSDPVGVNAELVNAHGALNMKFLFFVKGNKIVNARIKGVSISQYLTNEYTRFMDRFGGNAPIANLIDDLAGKNPPCP